MFFFFQAIVSLDYLFVCLCTSTIILIQLGHRKENGKRDASKKRWAGEMKSFCASPPYTSSSSSSWSSFIQTWFFYYHHLSRSHPHRSHSLTRLGPWPPPALILHGHLQSFPTLLSFTLIDTFMYYYHFTFSYINITFFSWATFQTNSNLSFNNLFLFWLSFFFSSQSGHCLVYRYPGHYLLGFKPISFCLCIAGSSSSFTF